jgi:hypothetical protein
MRIAEALFMERDGMACLLLWDFDHRIMYRESGAAGRGVSR